MASRDITDEFATEVARDLQRRYALDDDDVRALGARLAQSDRAARSAENVAFADRVLTEHAGTIKRLSE